MTRRRWSALLVSLVLAVVTALAASSCGVDPLTLGGHPCPCGPDYVCDTARNLCVTPAELADAAATSEAGAGPCLGDSCACTTVADCKDPAFPKCVGKKCVECTSGPDTCGAGRYCLPSNACAPGCKSDAECAALSPSAPFCNVGRHQCVNCATDANCTNGQKCSPAGACADACTGGTCPGGKECCGGLCIDTQSDPLNCKTCGNACTGAQTACCAGACTDPLTSADNCGRCGTECSTTNGTPSCAAGSCKWACNPGFSHCNSGSNSGCETDTSSNALHCGSCTTNCNTTVVNATGIACAASLCTYAACNATFSDCDAKKTNGCECVTGGCGFKTQLCCNNTTCYAGLQCEQAPANDGKCH